VLDRAKTVRALDSAATAIGELYLIYSHVDMTSLVQNIKLAFRQNSRITNRSNVHIYCLPIEKSALSLQSLFIPSYHVFVDKGSYFRHCGKMLIAPVSIGRTTAQKL
jgi:hypothetical protein